MPKANKGGSRKWKVSALRVCRPLFGKSPIDFPPFHHPFAGNWFRANNEIDRDFNVHVLVSIPAGGYTWLVVSSA
jgi:hypothetical protein